MQKILQMLRIHTLKIVQGNRTLCGSGCLQFLYVCEPSLLRKTPEWPLCVFLASCVIYYGVGVIWQPSYSMCDVMFVR